MFEFTPTANPKIWTYTVQVSFPKLSVDSPYEPDADLNFGTDVNHLYSTTSWGGLHNTRHSLRSDPALRLGAAPSTRLGRIPPIR